jgi:hypothetical protein
MSDRSDEMTDLPKANQQRTVRDQSDHAGMSDGTTAPAHTPRQQSSLTGMNDDTTDHVHIPNGMKPTKIKCRVNSFEDKVRDMPGSIRTFDGPADARPDIGDDKTAPPGPISSDGATFAITTSMQTIGHGKCLIGLDESTVACLEPLLIGLMARLLEMSLCIIQTLGKVLYMSYVYSETGEMKMEGELVLNILRSILYTLILGSVAAALLKVIQLAVKIGVGIVWVLEGVMWVLT